MWIAGQDFQRSAAAVSSTNRKIFAGQSVLFGLGPRFSKAHQTAAASIDRLNGNWDDHQTQNEVNTEQTGHELAPQHWLGHNTPIRR